MHIRKRPIAAATAVAVAGALAAGGVATAGAAKGGPVLDIVGKETFRDNQSYVSTYRFAPGKLTVKSGQTVKIVRHDKAQEGHSVTLTTKRNAKPKGFNDCKACEQAFQDHQPNGPDSPPVPLVEKGGEGFDKPGDSIFLADGKAQKIKITAKKGTTLYYLCALHPWMRGTIKVR
jgi:plastocyanin